jgi:holliday junction DNA helicase RuvA
MIAYLKGDFVYKSPSLVHVEVQGVGYEVQISLHTYGHIQSLEKGLLYTYLQIKEDAHTLFGFFDTAEKEMFVLLIGVSGIGATTARIMLSCMRPEELARAITGADLRTLEGIKGIGKKTAERIVLELRDKLAKHPVESNIPALKHNTLQQDALNALLALGIARQAGEQAIQKAQKAGAESTTLEELIKQALKML